MKNGMITRSVLTGMLFLWVLIMTGCKGEGEPCSKEMRAVITTPAAYTFYEVDVPFAAQRQALHEAGIGLYPHAKSLESEGADLRFFNRYVALLSEEDVELLTSMGYNIELASRSSFADMDWDMILASPNCTLSADAVREAEMNPDERIAAGFSPLGIRTSFCQFDYSDYPCDVSIREEMESFEASHPPIAGQKYVELVTTGTTHENRPIYAMRIGKITTEQDPESTVLLYVAAQHAREWVTTEMAMRVMRYYADAYRDNLYMVRNLLSDKTLVVVPVVNPDGYQYTHDLYRLWRKNRNPDPQCTPPDIGVDPNRNFPYTWDQPGGASLYCDHDTYRGQFPASENETNAMRNLVFNSGVTPSGKYRPAVLLNIHSYGNYVLWVEGNGIDAEGKYCDIRSNCMFPDHGAMRTLFGSEYRPIPWLRDEVKLTPYATDSLYRNIYQVSGGLSGDVMMGDPMGSRNAFAAGFELTNTSSGFYAEYLPPGQIDDLAYNQREFVHYVLMRLLKIDDGSYFASEVGHYSLPMVERRCYQQNKCWYEIYHRPRFYVSALKTLSSITITPPPGYIGVTGMDLEGYAYDLYRWKPDTDFLFPPEFKVCAQGVPCDYVSLDGSEGPVDLGDPSMFTGGSGFAWDTDGRFWIQTGGVGSYLKRKWSNLSKMVDAHLFYSYKFDPDAGYHVKVIVEYYPGYSKTIRVYPRDHVNDVRVNGFRTESLDVKFVDCNQQVRVIFQVVAGPGTPPPPDDEFQVGDVVFVGWKK